MQIKTITGIYQSNTFVVTQGQEALVVDSGATLADVAAAVGNCQVRGVLVTHEHFDHLTHCVAYAKYFQAPLFVSIETWLNLKFTIPKAAAELEPTAVLPDASDPLNRLDEQVVCQILDGSQPLQLGAFTIEVLAVPGHSSGSLAFLVADAFFTGDLLFQRGIGNIYMTHGHAALLQSLQRVQQLTFSTAYHGHGAPSTYAEQTKNLRVWLKWLSR